MDGRFSPLEKNQTENHMKKYLAKLTLITVCAAAALAVPALSHAQDSTNAPAASVPATTHKKHTIPFHGNLAAVDTNAMTLTVGTMTLQITSKTKITKDGEPAVLADGVVGEPVSGSYKKGDDDTTNAVSIHFGAKKKADSASTGN
jgi:hypothetical protein